jgi:galactitol-specific phosphotransferase system IIB component
MFGDASGAGFGSSLMIEKEIHYLHHKSSYYRELGSLINAIKDASSKGLL